MQKKTLSQTDIRSITVAVDLGSQLQEDHPSLAQDYRQGISPSELLDLYRIPARYDVQEHVARRALCYALSGFSGGFARDPYAGLLHPEERRHFINIFSQRRGSALTARMREERHAIYGQTREERCALGKKGGIALTLQRDQVPWTAEETVAAYTLWTDPVYKRTQPPQPGRPDLERITQAINYHYHHDSPVRTKASIDVAVRKYRKKHDLSA